MRAAKVHPQARAHVDNSLHAFCRSQLVGQRAVQHAGGTLQLPCVARKRPFQSLLHGRQRLERGCPRDGCKSDPRSQQVLRLPRGQGLRAAAVRCPLLVSARFQERRRDKLLQRGAGRPAAVPKDAEHLWRAVVQQGALAAAHVLTGLASQADLQLSVERGPGARRSGEGSAAGQTRQARTRRCSGSYGSRREVAPAAAHRNRAAGAHP